MVGEKRKQSRKAYQRNSNRKPERQSPSINENNKQDSFKAIPMHPDNLLRRVTRARKVDFSLHETESQIGGGREQRTQPLPSQSVKPSQPASESEGEMEISFKNQSNFSPDKPDLVNLTDASFSERDECISSQAGMVSSVDREESEEQVVFPNVFNTPSLGSAADGDGTYQEGIHHVESGTNTSLPLGTPAKGPQKEDLHQDVSALIQSNDIILKTLEGMNGQLQKLDTLESLTQNLKTDLSKVQSQVEEVSVNINSVKTDLEKYEGRLSKLEKSAQSWDKKLELHREAIASDFQVVQSSIDSNSKKAIALESKLNHYKGKWDSLDKLEDKIKQAANSKFQTIKAAVKTELAKEILDKAREKPLVISPEDLQDIKQQILKDLSPATPEVTREDLQELRREYSEKLLAHNKVSLPNPNVNRLREQAFLQRHNLLVFGIADYDSTSDDLKAVRDFFKFEMGLTGLKIKVTYRLGNFRPGSVSNRPIVVKFANIADKWVVWNNKSRIRHNREAPVRIQLDLPKQLREENRVLQRVAKIARQKSEVFGLAKVKDYKVIINNEPYGIENLKDLPSELHPEHIYTPRSDNAVVFFTKHSPLSNHHLAPFEIDGFKFSCVEQYLAVAKARLAENKVLEEKAKDNLSPAEYKGILNNLRKDVQGIWSEKAPDIILPAIRAKFKQNERLTNFLVETYPLPIGEASRDSIWGIGLPLEHADVLDLSKWDHQGNLLGYTLMQVREEIMREIMENDHATSI